MTNLNLTQLSPYNWSDCYTLIYPTQSLWVIDYLEYYWRVAWWVSGRAEGEELGGGSFGQRLFKRCWLVIPIIASVNHGSSWDADVDMDAFPQLDVCGSSRGRTVSSPPPGQIKVEIPEQLFGVRWWRLERLPSLVQWPLCSFFLWL